MKLPLYKDIINPSPHTFRMRFTSWLWNQVDDLGDQAGFSKIAWDDVNNGCASARFSAKDWVAHFNEKHPERADFLIELLVRAYGDYMTEEKK